MAGMPLSIVSGIAIGMAIGFVSYKIFSTFNIRITKQVLSLLAISVLLLFAEDYLKGIIPMAALLSVISIGYIILNKSKKYASLLSIKLSKIWILAEVILFTIVGAQVNIDVAFDTGLTGALIILAGLIARSIGSYICLFGSDLNFGERVFVVVSYLPKATVQAAYGAAPLAAGMSIIAGETILAVCVI